MMSTEELHPQDRPDETDADPTAADDAPIAEGPINDSGSVSDAISDSDANSSSDAEKVGEEAVLREDDTAPLEPASHVSEMDAGTVENSDEPASADRTASVAKEDDTGDAAGISEEMAARPTTDTSSVPLRWDFRRGAHDAAVELKRIETEVRQLLESCDSRRKRKLGGTYRWKELEDDLISWRFGGRINDDTIVELQRLIAKRNCHFQKLRFLSRTRTTWNS